MKEEIMNIDDIMNCPECGISWDGGDINEVMRNIYEGSIDELKIKEWVASYGWTKKNPKRFKENVIGIEDPELYDGVSFWECSGCKAQWNRFTGEQVKEREL